jgi:hypothetical protein
MRLSGEKPAPVRVRVEWLRLMPGQGLRFWGLVGSRVRERRVRTKDLVRVRAIAEEVRREMSVGKQAYKHTSRDGDAK